MGKCWIAFAAFLAVLHAGAVEFLPASFKGVVTLHRHGDPYFFVEAEDGTAWRCEVTPGEPLPHIHPGDIVEVSGVKEDDINRPRLFDAKWQVTGHDESRIPAPMRTTVGELYATATNPEGGERDWYAKYMAVEGVVRDINRRRTYTQIQLGDDTDSMQLSIRVNADVPLPEHLAIGAKARCAGCGIYTILRDQEKKFIRVNSFALMVQGFDSLEVLSRPPWWTPARIWTAAGLGAFTITMLAVWIALLLRARRAERASEKLLAAARRRIADDLHDNMQQLLAGAMFRLDAARSSVDNPIAAAQQIAGARKAVEYCQAGLRSVLWGLQEVGSAKLGSRNLGGGIAGLFKYAASRMPHWEGVVSITTEGNESNRLRRHGARLLMILQEAVGNALVHGGAAKIDVHLVFFKKSLVMTVSDNGCGFAPNAVSGLGIPSMKRRAEEIGGVLRVESEPGKGTKITVEVGHG